MLCCNDKESVNTKVSLPQTDPCKVNEQLKDMFVYFEEERLKICGCDPLRFSVDHNHVDNMTVSYLVLDRLTDKTIEYTVKKKHEEETPQETFTRDWLSRELLYERGVINDIRDIRDYLNVNGLDPVVAKLNKGYDVTIAINGDLVGSGFSYRMKETPLITKETSDLEELLARDLSGIIIALPYLKFLKRLESLGVSYLEGSYLETKLTDEIISSKLVIVGKRDIDTELSLEVKVELFNLDKSIDVLKDIFQYYNIGTDKC